MRIVHTTLVVNEKERAALHALAPDAHIRVIENGIDLTSFLPEGPPEASASVVFCGVMNYGPNVLGAIWLAREVWPLVRASRPDAQLTLIGASPTSAVKGLANDAFGIVVTGTVPDVRPYLQRAAVAAAPLRVARGVQNKVLEAVASGLPCVVTQQVAAGLPRELSPACRIGATAEEFASSLIALLNRTPSERRAEAVAADLQPLQWSARLQPLMPLLATAAARRRSVGDAAGDSRSQRQANRLLTERLGGPEHVLQLLRQSPHWRSALSLFVLWDRALERCETVCERSCRERRSSAAGAPRPGSMEGLVGCSGWFLRFG